MNSQAKVYLHPDARVLVKDENCQIIHRKVYSFKHNNTEELTLLMHLHQGLEIAELGKLTSWFRGLIVTLSKKQVVYVADSAACAQEENNRTFEWLRHMTRQPRSAFDRIKNSCIAIVGCGGIGAHLATQLAASGVGHLVLIDYSSLNLSDLNRQYVFDRKQVGMPKVYALQEKLEANYPQAKVSVFHERAESASSLLQSLSSVGREITGLVCAADEPPILIKIACAEASLKLGSMFTSASVGLCEWSLGPTFSLAHDIEEYISKQQWLLSEAKAFGDIEILRASIASSNTLCSSALCQEVIDYLTSTNFVARPERFFSLADLTGEGKSS